MSQGPARSRSESSLRVKAERERVKQRSLFRRAMVRATYLCHLWLRIFVYGDTLPIRVLMAGASVVFAVVVVVYPSTFERQAFSGMGAIVLQFEWGRLIGPGFFWGTLFMAHGIGVAWRIVETRQRIYWALAINWLGWVLWCTEIVMTSAALGEIPAGNALNIPAVVALFIALIRTGLNDEKVSA